MALIIGPQLFYGFGFEAPEELLEAGFLVIQRPREWVKARKDGNDFFIKRASGALELWPCRYDGQKTPLNPRGEFVDVRGEPIIIRQPKSESAAE